MNILVTGGHGRIGYWIASEMSKLDCSPIFRPKRDQFDLLCEDERWDQILSRPWDLLIHCAWNTEHGSFWDDPVNSSWREASERLFERFWEAGGRRIVGIGSCAEYAWPVQSVPLQEGQGGTPATPYGKEKLETFLRLQELSESFDRSYVWARVFFTFGPGDARGKLLPAMLEAQLAQAEMRCGHKTLTRDFCDYESVGRMIARVARSNANGPINIGSGVGLSLENIYDEVVDICGGKRVVSFSSEIVQGQNYVVADITKLKMLNIFDEDFEVRRRLRDYLNWMRLNLKP